MHSPNISLAPIATDAAAPVVARVEKAFAALLIADKAASAKDAFRCARDLCARELSQLREQGAGGFYAINRSSKRIGDLWIAERDVPVSITWHILYIEIVSAQRSQGIAGTAMGLLIAMARRAGTKAITLNVSPTNVAAVALYRRQGFRRYSDGLILHIAE